MLWISSSSVINWVVPSTRRVEFDGVGFVPMDDEVDAVYPPVARLRYPVSDLESGFLDFPPTLPRNLPIRRVVAAGVIEAVHRAAGNSREHHRRVGHPGFSVTDHPGCAEGGAGQECGHDHQRIGAQFFDEFIPLLRERRGRVDEVRLVAGMNRFSPK